MENSRKMISTPKNTPVSGALNAAEILTDPQLRRDLNAAEICDPAGAISFTLHQPGGLRHAGPDLASTGRSSLPMRCRRTGPGPGAADDHGRPA
jgi:hypothetical protein